MRFLSGVSGVDPEQDDPQATFLRPRGTEQYVWNARRTANGVFVGWFCLWPDGERVAELGYRLRREEWGKGMASEGALALVNWGFESGLYDKVFASTMAVNTGSRRVMEKIGMTHTRTVHADWSDPIPGSEHGDVEYAVTRAALNDG